MICALAMHETLLVALAVGKSPLQEQHAAHGVSSD